MNEQHGNHRYPDHLYDPIRREIGIQLIDKEMRKQLISTSDEDNVRVWMESLDDHTFWNTIEGYMGGSLIKPIVHFLTADNYHWSKREVLLADIQLSSQLQQLDSIEGLSSKPPLLSEVRTQLDSNPLEKQKQLEHVKTFDRGELQDEYPVLMVEKENGPMVMDGNRRCLKSLLMGELAITAWHCETNGEQPKNFWYPIDDMMRLVKVYNTTKDADPEIKTHIQATLQAIFAQSDVAKIAFEDRIVKSGTPGAKELFS